MYFLCFVAVFPKIKLKKKKIKHKHRKKKHKSLQKKKKNNNPHGMKQKKPPKIPFESQIHSKHVWSVIGSHVNSLIWLQIVGCVKIFPDSSKHVFPQKLIVGKINHEDMVVNVYPKPSHNTLW